MKNSQWYFYNIFSLFLPIKCENGVKVKDGSAEININKVRLVSQLEIIKYQATFLID